MAPAILAIVERGAHHRPAIAAALRGEVELSTGASIPPVRIVFGERSVLVEDGEAQRPDLRVTGSLPDLVSLMVSPLLVGLPSPVGPRAARRSGWSCSAGCGSRAGSACCGSGSPRSGCERRDEQPDAVASALPAR